MKLRALLLVLVALAPLGGCIGAPGHFAFAPDGIRSAGAQTTPTGGGGPASTLILGVQ